MRKRFLVPFLVLAIAFAFPASAVAGSFTLHPSGFGEKSRANWKAQSGLPDPGTGTGSPTANQALYLQKMTATETFAAGVAIFKFDPFPVSEFQGLEFWYGTDGWCGAGAPRFNLRLRPPSGPTQLFFIGCAEMVNGTTATAPSGRVFQQKTFTAPGPTACCGALPTSGFDVVSLAIVFDEGTTQFGLPLGPGFVYLDKIKVQTSGLNGSPGTKTWNSASDNSNAAAAIPVGPSVAYADEVSDVLSLLGEMFPEVPLTAWTLYPDVELADLPPITVGAP